MRETIYRDDAIDAICKACSIVGDYHKCDGYPETSTWCEELVALRALPSAEPERKKGKWIRENIVLTSNPPQYQWHCSECGRLVHWFSTEILTNFFPNCGADMREMGREDK